MQEQTAEEKQLAELIVESLNLEDTLAADIGPDDSLFGAGLGLDSIDALELALAISKNYSIQFKTDDERMKKAFETLRSLNAFIRSNPTDSHISS